MEFKLPDIGEGVFEGEITKWLVKAGDTIEADQPMVEVMTDKATVEIPSPVSGVVESLTADEGQTIEVGKVIITIQEKGNGATDKATPAPAPVAKAAPKASASSVNQDVEVESQREDEAIPFNVLATPATRKLARDLKVSIAKVSGTGPKGRVTKSDVQLYYEGGQAATERPSQTAAAPAPSTAMTRAPLVDVGTVKRIPLKGIRKKIAEAMAHSTRTAAHFTFVEEVDMTDVVALRKANKDEAAKQGVKLTFLPFIIKALIPALKEFPFLNASLDDAAGEIVLKGDYNIGIATDTDNGLMVPVVKSADRLSIFDLARKIDELAVRARDGKSVLDDLKGGSFTITNAGSIGGVFATPVINHPEVAILGVNAIRKRPMVVDDQIVVRDMMYLSLSVDHRVVDGADAARFMNRLIYFLSDPTRLVFA